MNKEFEEKLASYLDRIKKGEHVEAKDIPTFNEAIMSDDASLWFPQVIANMIEQVTEPILVGANLLRQTTLTQGSSYSFMALGALRAFEIAEGMPYPEQSLALRQMTEGRVSKKGLSFSMTDEVLDEAQWGIWGLHIEHAGRALARLKEEIIFNDINNLGQTVFDNTVNATATTGQSSAAASNPNGSLHLDDLVDLVGQIVTNEYQPTDIVMHPLAWTILAKEPMMRNAAYYGSAQLWQNLPNTSGGAAAGSTGPYMNSVAPWGLTIAVSPFVTRAQVGTATMCANVQSGITDDYGGNTTLWSTSIYCVDRNNLGVLLTKEKPTTERFDDPSRDVRAMKIRERYGVVILDEGYASSVAKKVLVTKNYATI